jgi:putative copper export protein
MQHNGWDHALKVTGDGEGLVGHAGTVEEDKDVTQITHLMSRAANWPGGLRWIARRAKPSRRQMPNLTAYEKKTGWRYSITCTNIPVTAPREP